MPPAISELLLLAVARHRIRMIIPVTPPVVGIAIPPLCGGCRGRLCDIQDRRRSFAGDSRSAAGAGKQPRRRLPEAVGTSKVGRISDSSGSAVRSYQRLSHLTNASVPGTGSSTKNRLTYFKTEIGLPRTRSPPCVTAEMDLETAVECIPHPRRCHLSNFKPGELRSFYPGTDT